MKKAVLCGDQLGLVEVPVSGVIIQITVDGRFEFTIKSFNLTVFLTGKDLFKQNLDIWYTVDALKVLRCEAFSVFSE